MSALALLFVEQFEALWEVGGRKCRWGHRPCEGGYAKNAKNADFPDSPGRGTHTRFSLEKSF